MLKIAIRNVHKNLRSMALNGVGIALTVFLLVFIFSLSRGIENQIVNRNIRFETGGVMIRLDKEITGWEKQAQGDSLFRVMQTALETHPDIRGYRARISTGNASLYGKDAVQRIRIEGLTPGELPLLNEMVAIVEGNTGWQEISNGLLISKELAEETGLVCLDESAIVLPSADGSVNMQDYVVTGIFQNTSFLDKYQTYMLYEQARELYHTHLPTKLLVDLNDLKQADRVASSLSAEITSPDVEIKTYTDFMGRARALSSINRNALLGMASFLLFISFVGIWAMIVEQLNERRREVGTLLTFGFSRRSVKGIFLIESVYVSLLFSGVGLFVVWGLIGILDYHQGIYLGRLASFAFGSSTVLPELKITDLLFSAGIALFYPLIATWLSLLPVGRTKVIEYLR